MPNIPTFPTILDHVKQISISKLKEWDYLKTNSFKSGTINWSRAGNEIGSIRISCKMTAEEPYIQLSYTYNKEESVNYRVKLVSVSSNLGVGKLWYFLCPETGKRCRILYGAGKYFLHREAYPDAMYEKQTYSKQMRKLDRLFSTVYSTDDLMEELYSKHFKTHYAGKPTGIATKKWTVS
ncbi:hypothetical protein ACG2F4_19285 [Halalkalibaculum sp. DA3122]|uniref:hypothetical protein n=1 Tax=Halalkalibaculum sp. DA3122 TaxID=3373607 RepID=UPI0037548280